MIKRKRKHMNYFRFLEELKKRGFKFSEGYFSNLYLYKDITVSISGGGIDDDGELHPYILMLNSNRVIGNQRCLNYIDKLLKEVS